MSLVEKISGLKGKEICCLEVNILEDNSYRFNLSILKKEKNRLNIEKTETQLDSFELLKSKIKRKLPIVIVITGKGIIFRKAAITPGVNNIEILRKLLPNAVPGDFYTCKSEIYNGQAFISVIRSELAEKILKIFNDHKLFVVGLYIGPLISESVLEIADSLPEIMNLSNYKITIKNRKIETCIIQQTDKEEFYKIGDESVSSFTILSLSSGIKYLSNEKYNSFTEISTVNNNITEYKAFRSFRVLGAGFLGLFFVILLINYLLFDFYNSKSDELSSRLTDYQGFLNNYNVLKKDLEDKKSMLTETGMLLPSKKSFFVDRIAADIPEGINLTELIINPIVRKQSEINKIDFIKNKINIKGYTIKSTLLNEWIKKLKKYEWIREVKEFTYSSEDQFINKPGAFTIEIENR